LITLNFSLRTGLSFIKFFWIKIKDKLNAAVIDRELNKKVKMNAVTNPQLSTSVDTDEHDNRKERENIETLSTTQTSDGKKTDDITNVQNDHLTHDNTDANKPDSHDTPENTFNQSETQKAQEDRVTSETTQNDAESRSDINHDNGVKKENDSETSYPQEFSKIEDSRDDKKLEEPENVKEEDKWVTRDESLDSHDDEKAQERVESFKYNDTKEENETETHQKLSLIEEARDDDDKSEASEYPFKEKKDTRDETLDNQNESDTSYHQEFSIPDDHRDNAKIEADGDHAKDEQNTRDENLRDDRKAETPDENAKNDHWNIASESLTNRHDTKVETFEADEDQKIPSSDFTKVTEYQPQTDDDTSIRTERLVVDDENDTRDTFSVSASDNDIRDSLFVEKTRIDDDSFIHTERLVVDDDDSRNPLSVPTSEIETKTDESDDNLFNRSEKLRLDDENNTRDTHTTLSVPSDTETSYKLKAADENENILTHPKEPETRYDTNEPIREEASSVDKSNARYDKEIVSPDDEKAANKVELENETDNDSDDEFADGSPGMILRQAREQQKLSVKHIADRLYLDVHVIEALEADDYDILPPTIFVRGYLRNYAKLLEVPTASIMSSFDKLQQPTMVPVFTAPSKPKRQASSRDLWATFVTFIVAISLLIGVALWQFYPKTSSDPQLTVTTPGENFPPVINGLPVIENQQPLTGMNGSDTNDPLKNAANNPSNPDEKGSDESEKQEEPAPEPTLQTMQVRFKERSWVRISDKTGKRLYQGIGNAGEILPLEGMQPFQVHVGNVGGVSVEYNGEIKDIRDYPRQRRTRRIFIVGSDD
jgi:cytoskeleton protein RodZ